MISLENFDWKTFYFSFEGRVNRKKYWLNLTIPIFLISIVLAFIDHSIGLTVDDTGILSSIFSIAMIWPYVAVGAKRLHDRGLSGWWQAVPIVAMAFAGMSFAFFYPLGILFAIAAVIVGFCLSIQIGCLKGVDGDNDYGSDPLGGDSDGGNNQIVETKDTPSAEQEGSDKNNYERVGAGE